MRQYYLFGNIGTQSLFLGFVPGGESDSALAKRYAAEGNARSMGYAHVNSLRNWPAYGRLLPARDI